MKPKYKVVDADGQWILGNFTSKERAQHRIDNNLMPARMPRCYRLPLRVEPQ